MTTEELVGLKVELIDVERHSLGLDDKVQLSLAVFDEFKMEKSGSIPFIFDLDRNKPDEAVREMVSSVSVTITKILTDRIYQLIAERERHEKMMRKGKETRTDRTERQNLQILNERAAQRVGPVQRQLVTPAITVAPLIVPVVKSTASQQPVENNPELVAVGDKEYWSNNPFVKLLQQKQQSNDHFVGSSPTTGVPVCNVKSAANVTNSSSANSTLTDATDFDKAKLTRLDNPNSTSNLNGIGDRPVVVVVDLVKLNLASQQSFAEPKSSTGELPSQLSFAPVNTVSPPSSSDVMTNNQKFPWGQGEFRFLPVTPPAVIPNWRKRFACKKTVPVVIVKEKRSLKTLFKRQFSTTSNL